MRMIVIVPVLGRVCRVLLIRRGLTGLFYGVLMMMVAVLTWMMPLCTCLLNMLPWLMTMALLGLIRPMKVVLTLVDFGVEMGSARVPLALKAVCSRLPTLLTTVMKCGLRRLSAGCVSVLSMCVGMGEGLGLSSRIRGGRKDPTAGSLGPGW